MKDDFEGHGTMADQLFQASKKMDKAMLEFAKAHMELAEKLTVEQLASALRQAVTCGDFQKLVCFDPAYDGKTPSQAVTYIPFRERDELRAKVAALSQELTNYKLGFATQTEEREQLEAKVAALEEERTKWRRGYDTLAAEKSNWIRAFGLVSTLHPTMEIDMNDPEKMANKIHTHVMELAAENAELKAVIQKKLDHPNWNFEVTCGAEKALAKESNAKVSDPADSEH